MEHEHRIDNIVPLPHVIEPGFVNEAAGTVLERMTPVLIQGLGMCVKSFAWICGVPVRVEKTEQ